jgi:hypothetical protein
MAWETMFGHLARAVRAHAPGVLDYDAHVDHVVEALAETSGRRAGDARRYCLRCRSSQGTLNASAAAPTTDTVTRPTCPDPGASAGSPSTAV